MSESAQPVRREGERRRPPRSALLLVAGLAACSLSTGVDPENVTVTVVNATCASGACEAIHVGGWVGKYLVPGQPIGGAVQLGIAENPVTCFTFPPSDSLRIGSQGGEHHTVRWTTDEPLQVTVVVVNPTTGFFGGREVVIDRTDWIVPTASPGWRLTFPGDDGHAHIEAAEPCRG